MAKKGLLDRIVDDIFDAFWTDEVTGAYGEWLTGNELRRLSFLLGDGHVLRNLYVPTADGRTSEVDLVPHVAKRGPHAGERFWGCSGYPSCRYIAPM